MKKVIALSLAVCLTIAVFPLTVLANDSTLGGTGMTVYPIYGTDVVMEEEIIDITVKDGRSYVNCQFFFHNTGEKTELLVGFPTQYPGWYESQEDFDKEKEEDYYADSHVTELHRFRTWVDGKQAKVTVKKGLKPEGNNTGELYFPQWYTWTMTLEAGERVKVVNTYWAENSYGGENWESSRYILRSGATWKGPIGKVTVRMHMSELQRIDASFRGPDYGGILPSYLEDDGTVVWKAENIKPTQDVQASFTQQNTSYSVYFPLENPFEYGVTEQEADYDEYERMGQRLLRHFYAGHYNAVTWWADRFIRRFGGKQSWQLYFLAGMSYYKKGRYEKALAMLEKSDAEYKPCMYFKTLAYRDSGNEVKYRECLEKLASIKDEDNGSVYWISLWAQGRLDALNKTM